MLIQPINVFDKCLSTKQSEQTGLNYTQGLSSSTVSFLGGKTTAGNPFRKLTDVPDAYFGGPTIRNADIPAILRDIANCKTVSQTVNYLQKYKQYLLKTEKYIFECFENAAKTSPDSECQDILKQLYDEAIIKLKLEEFAVIDNINSIASRLSPETNFAVRRKMAICTNIIIDNAPQRQFKRKTILESLGNIPVKPGEEKIMKSLLETAVDLPTSATSENAFIVKYANRSHNEISNRLITPSVLSIDHVLAAFHGGTNDIDNFLPVSTGANGIKEDMPFTKFIRRYPQVIKNCQKFIDFMIDIINNGGFRGHQAYPYEIKERLKQESGRMVKLDLSALKYTKKEAKKLEHEAKHTNKKRRVNASG